MIADRTYRAVSFLIARVKSRLGFAAPTGQKARRALAHRAFRLRGQRLEVREQLVALNLRLARCDQQIATHARCSDVARRAGDSGSRLEEKCHDHTNRGRLQVRANICEGQKNRTLTLTLRGSPCKQEVLANRIGRLQPTAADRATGDTFFASSKTPCSKAYTIARAAVLRVGTITVATVTPLIRATSGDSRYLTHAAWLYSL
jgi:hypothetical protein